MRLTLLRLVALSIGIAFVVVDVKSVEGQRTTAAFDTIGGVIHVRNSADPAWRPNERWRIEEILRIGAVEGRPEEMFSSSLLTPIVGPDGTIYVLDSELGTIRVFDSSGDVIGSIGRLGRGPGELIAPSGLVLDGYGRLWIVTELGRLYAVFSSRGDFSHTARRPAAAIARRQHPVVYRDDGTILDELSAHPNIFVVAIDTTATSVDTLVELERPPLARHLLPGVPIRPGSAFQTVARYYLRRAVWATTTDGLVWSMENDDLTMNLLNGKGDTIRVIHTAHRESQLSNEDLGIVRRAARELGLGLKDIGAVRPLVQAIYPVPDGHLLVQIIETPGEESSLFDVFDPKGVFLGTMDFGFAPARLGVMSVTNATVTAPVVGEWDVPYVVQARIRRPP